VHRAMGLVQALQRLLPSVRVMLRQKVMQAELTSSHHCDADQSSWCYKCHSAIRSQGHTQHAQDPYKGQSLEQPSAAHKLPARANSGHEPKRGFMR
jgi:hypothetical protein